MIDKSFDKISPAKFLLIHLFEKKCACENMYPLKFSHENFYSQKCVPKIRMFTGILNDSYLKRCRLLPVSFRLCRNPDSYNRCPYRRKGKLEHIYKIKAQLVEHLPFNLKVQSWKTAQEVLNASIGRLFID